MVLKNRKKWKPHTRAFGWAARGVCMDRLRDQDPRPQPARRSAPRRRGRSRAGARCRAGCGGPPRCARTTHRSGARTASDARGDPAARLSHAGRNGRSSAGLAPLVRRRAGPLVSAAKTLEDSIRLAVDCVGEVAGGRCVGLGANFLARSRVRAHGFSDPPAGVSYHAGLSVSPERPVCLYNILVPDGISSLFRAQIVTVNECRDRRREGQND